MFAGFSEDDEDMNASGRIPESQKAKEYAKGR